MKPFFGKEETKADQITKIPTSCASCGLHKTARNPRAKPHGKFGKKILIIGEAPNRRDDARGKAWTGEQGDFIKEIFRKNGIHIYRDCITSYAVICPIPKDKKPEDKEIMCCRRKITKLIKELKPKMIFLVGSAAVHSIIGANWKKGVGGMDRWRGWQIPDRAFNTWLCPIFTPKYAETRDIWKKTNLAEVIWSNDIKSALKRLDQPLKFTDEKKFITYVENDKHFKSIMPKLLKADLMSFDYEGTGLKPHAKGHLITNTAACIGKKECYSWMNTPLNQRLFKKVLEKRSIKKSAHNMAFENMWSRVILDAEVRGWFWDTMINAHILDNRKAISSLKFQTYVNFGVADYDSHVNPFLQSGDEQGANSFNTIVKYIKQYGPKPILTYCGLDAIYGYYLTILQMALVKSF